MGPNTTTTPSSTSRAARVFGIRELLEHILILLTINMTEARTVVGGFKLEPIATLSRCQAVNHDFSVTIAGSKKLQQLMTIAASVESNHEAFITLSWLLDNQLDFLSSNSSSFETSEYFPGGKLVPEYTFEAELEMSDGALDEQLERLEIFKRENGREEATWRRVKLCCQPAIILVSMIGMQAYYGGRVDLEFDESNTLGSVFDSFSAELKENGSG